MLEKPKQTGGQGGLIRISNNRKGPVYIYIVRHGSTKSTTRGSTVKTEARIFTLPKLATSRRIYIATKSAKIKQVAAKSAKVTTKRPPIKKAVRVAKNAPKPAKAKTLQKVVTKKAKFTTKQAAGATIKKAVKVAYAKKTTKKTNRMQPTRKIITTKKTLGAQKVTKIHILESTAKEPQSKQFKLLTN